MKHTNIFNIMKPKPVKPTAAEEVTQLLKSFGANELNTMLEAIYELFRLYDVEPETDWLTDLVLDPEEVREVRLSRTAYIISRLADRSANTLKKIARNHPGLWQRIEIEARHHDSQQAG